MQGIKCITNEKGQKVAVIIDLKKYGEFWEDFNDSVTARKRAKESRESLESVKKRLRQHGKLND
ncbi:MAG TPA: hypothetical protein VFD70_05475 [Anaerolineae bacterium]|nr:hypothetical protein [Anaerolineae bacterium]